MTSGIITEEIEKEYPDVLNILLQDHSTKKNIVWGTDNYKINGKGYHAEDTMKISSISGEMRKLIKPRICKTEREQKKRSKDMAEVFTPSWVCNFQNNAVDEKWFGHKDAFNKEEGKNWIPTEKVIFGRQNLAGLCQRSKTRDYLRRSPLSHKPLRCDKWGTDTSQNAYGPFGS